MRRITKSIALCWLVLVILLPSCASPSSELDYSEQLSNLEQQVGELKHQLQTSEQRLAELQQEMEQTSVEVQGLPQDILQLIQEALLESAQSDVQVLMDLGWGVSVMPHTNARGRTAITTCGIESGNFEKAPPILWELQEGTYPKQIANLHSINSEITSTTFPFVTFEDTILVRGCHFGSGELWLYRVKDGGISLVYTDEAATDLAYFAGQDPHTGAIYMPYEVGDRAVIIKSTDDGLTWTKVYDEDLGGEQTIYEIAAYKDKVYATNTDAERVIYSPDGGTTWQEVLDGSSKGYCLEGVSIINGMVLVPTNHGFWIAPHYTVPGRWFFIHIPIKNMVILRQSKLIGNGIVTNYYGYDMSAYLMTQDFFYTVSPVVLPPSPGSYTGNPGVMTRYSGFGNTLYLGSTADGGGLLLKVKLPENPQVRISCPHEILDLTSLAPAGQEGDTSTLPDCWEFEVAGGANFALTVSATYNASATQGIAVHVYTSYTNRNNEYDTEELKDSSGNPVFGDMPLTPGETCQVTRDISTSARFIKIIIENLDVAQTVTNIKVISTLGGTN